MERKKIAVIGLGSFGKRLTQYLFREGHEVLAIDKKLDAVEEVKDFSTTVGALDATEEPALRSIGIADMDIVVIALAEDFETSIVCADLLKKIGVREIHARFQTELHKRIYDLLGIKNTFNPEDTAAKTMAEILGYAQMKSAFLVSDEYSVSEITLPERCVDKTIAELDLRNKYSINIITVKRPSLDRDKKRASDKKEEKILGIPDGTLTLKAGDTLVIFGAQKDINKFLEPG